MNYNATSKLLIAALCGFAYVPVFAATTYIVEGGPSGQHSSSYTDASFSASSGTDTATGCTATGTRYSSTGTYFGKASSFPATVTGLSASNTYNFLVIPYTYDGTNATTYNYLTGSAPTTSGSTPAYVSYTRAGGASADWTVGSSWSPSRTAPATNDVLQFNVGGSVTATSVPNQTIAQLSVSGNTAVTLQPGAANTLTISGGASALSVASGS